MRFLATSSEHELATTGAESPGSQTPSDSSTPWSPRALTVVSARKLEKLALNSGTTGGAKCVKKPFIAAIISTAEGQVPFSVAQLECPLSPAINESEHFHCATSLHDHRDVRTSMNCTRTSTMDICRCTQRACERPGPRTGVQLWDLDCLLTALTRTCWTCTTNVDHLINVLHAAGESQWQKDHGNPHLRHDRGVDDKSL